MLSEELFKKEFKAMMKGRRELGRGVSVEKIPIPNLGGGVPKRQIVGIKGVEEPYFARLNGRKVELLPKMTLYKRKVLSDGTFRKDKEGREVKEQVVLKKGSVAVLSDIAIGLKNYKEDERGRKVRHIVSEGYGYVDYIENSKGERRYIYILPRKYVYKLNMCSLVISYGALRNYYKGVKVALTTGDYITIYVAPYKYRVSSGSRVLKVKPSLGFEKEISVLIEAWYKKGVIFNLGLLKSEDIYGNQSNLGYIEIKGNQEELDYKVLGESLEKIEEGMEYIEEEGY